MIGWNFKEYTMEQRKRNILLIALTALSMALVGCSSKKTNSSGYVPPSVDRSDNGGGVSVGTPPNDSDWGAMGYLDITSNEAYREFSGRSVEDVRNERIYIKLAEVVDGGKSYYEGEVRLAYDYDEMGNPWGSNAGQVTTHYAHPRFEALPYSEEELENNPKHLDQPIQGIRFNKFYTKSGKQFFVGFFEEPDFYDFYSHGEPGWDSTKKAGAVMIIIDDLDDSGFSGSVWFKNYKYTYAVKPTHTRCWDITYPNSPYNCRDFEVNGDVRPDLDNTPNEYTKLGEFYGLDVEEGFEN
jgi:hypothetical protein